MNIELPRELRPQVANPTPVLEKNPLDETAWIGNPKCGGIAAGTIREFVNLNEPETARLLYQRLNKNRTSSNYLSLQECTEYAQELRTGAMKNYKKIDGRA